jgi:hypothetical protein
MMYMLSFTMYLVVMIKNAFNKGLIDIYTLEVYNPKSCIYSQLEV